MTPLDTCGRCDVEVVKMSKQYKEGRKKKKRPSRTGRGRISIIGSGGEKKLPEVNRCSLEAFTPGRLLLYLISAPPPHSGCLPGNLAINSPFIGQCLQCAQMVFICYGCPRLIPGASLSNRLADCCCWFWVATELSESCLPSNHGPNRFRLTPSSPTVSDPTLLYAGIG